MLYDNSRLPAWVTSNCFSMIIWLLFLKMISSFFKWKMIQSFFKKGRVIWSWQLFHLRSMAWREWIMTPLRCKHVIKHCVTLDLLILFRWYITVQNYSKTWVMEKFGLCKNGRIRPHTWWNSLTIGFTTILHDNVRYTACKSYKHFSMNIWLHVFMKNDHFIFQMKSKTITFP